MEKRRELESRVGARTKVQRRNGRCLVLVESTRKARRCHPKQAMSAEIKPDLARRAPLPQRVFAGVWGDRDRPEDRDRQEWAFISKLPVQFGLPSAGNPSSTFCVCAQFGLKSPGFNSRLSVLGSLFPDERHHVED